MHKIIASILIGVLVTLTPAGYAADNGAGPPVPTKPCGPNYGRLALGGLKITAKTVGHVALSVPKALAFPLWFPVHATWMAGRAWWKGADKSALWKVPLKLIMKDGLAGLAWGWAFANMRGTIMTTHEMDNFALAGDKDTDEDLIVYVNGFNDDDDPVFHEATERFYNMRYGGKKRRIKINPENMKDLADQLKALVKKEGRKIKRLEFYGHGIKGGILVKDDALGSTELVEGSDDLKLSGVFQPNAKSIFYTCWTGDGKDGKEFMDTWGKMMFDRGGTVYGSKITLGGSPYLWSDMLAAPYLAYVGRGDAQEQVKHGNPYYRWDKFTKMDIPERARVLEPGE